LVIDHIIKMEVKDEVNKMDPVNKILRKVKCRKCGSTNVADLGYYWCRDCGKEYSYHEYNDPGNIGLYKYLKEEGRKRGLK